MQIPTQYFFYIFTRPNLRTGQLGLNGLFPSFITLNYLLKPLRGSRPRIITFGTGLMSGGTRCCQVSPSQVPQLPEASGLSVYQVSQTAGALTRIY